MFILGILGLFQAWFLPGLSMLSFSKNFKIIDIIILSIPLSITLNCLIIFTLVFFNLYDQENLLIIFFIELIFLIYNCFKNENLKKAIRSFEGFLRLKKKINIDFDIFDIPIVFFLLLISFFGFKTIGEVINVGDALVSYNPWSLTWFESEPSDYGLYPPGLSILMSLIYKMINNTSVEFFTRALVIIYPIWIFLFFYRVISFLPKYKIFIKFSLIISSYIFIFIFRNYAMFIGYAEPILFLTSVCTVFIMIKIFILEKNFESYEYLIFGLIVISNPIIKQTGFFISSVFPLLFFIFFIKKLSLKKLFSKLSIILIPFVIPYSWIALKLIKIYLLETSDTNLNFIISLNEGYSLIEKLNYTFGFLSIPFVILVLFSLINKKSLLIFITITLPYFVLYVIYIGYDNRHFVSIIPFISINITIGIYEIYKRINFSKINIPKFSFSILSILFVTLILLTINNLRNEERLISSSEKKKMLRGDREINALLYNFVKEDNFNIISIPDVLFSSFLPKIGDRVITNRDCKEPLSSDKIFYLLIKESYCNKYYKGWKKNLLNNDFKVLFHLNDHYLLLKEINN